MCYIRNTNRHHSTVLIFNVCSLSAMDRGEVGAITAVSLEVQITQYKIQSVMAQRMQDKLLMGLLY